MRIRDHRADDEPEINLVPLIDVILVLVIFFIITATFDGRSVLKLELPRASGQPAEQARPLSVLVNAEGRYFVEDREVLRNDVDSLRATIAEVAGSDRERPVLLRADDALGQLGFHRVMIATAPPQPQAEAGK